MTQRPTCLFLYTSEWRDKPTFKALPTSQDSPFLEIIYDTHSKGLHVVLKFTNKTLQFVPKIDKFGDLISLKSPRKFRNQDSRAAEERIEISRPAEYFIENRTEIENFIKRFCENEEDFRDIYTKFLDAPADVEMQATMQPSPDQQIADLVKGAEEHEARVLSITPQV